MDPHDALVDLERAAWRALSSDDAAATFYGDVLAGEVLVLLPGGLVIDDRDLVIESMGGRRGTPTSSLTNACSS